MKIALIADHLGPLPSAADAYPGEPAARVLSLASALASQDHQVTVYIRTDPAAVAARADRALDGLTVEHIRAGPQARLREGKQLPHIATFACQLAERWRHDAPDVAHAHSWTSGIAALAGARGLDIPVVQTFHSLGVDALPGRGRNGRGPAAAGEAMRVRLEGAIGRSVGAVLAGTTDERHDLARLGVPQAAVRIVPAGVDTTRFQPGGPAAERDKRPRLLMVRAPGDRQGLATALRALADVPGAELVIAGGPARARLARDSGYRALTWLARRLGVHDRLSCIGKVCQADMPPLMRSADVLVHLSQNRDFAMVPVEAMACGTPVVSSMAGGHADAVIHGNTGFLVPSAEPAALARRIRQLLASPMLLEGYGLAAANRARCRYGWERIGEETLAVYESLVEPGIRAAA